MCGWGEKVCLKMIVKQIMGVIATMGLCCLAGCEKAKIPKTVAVNEDGAMEIKVMSFNLRYENDGDRGAHAWKARIVGVVRMLREENVDVLGIQEGLHGQMADLWASLPGYDLMGNGRDDGLRKGEYAGIFFREDRFEIDRKKSGMIWLSATPEKAGSTTWGNTIPRVATWVKLTDRASGKILWVVNMHLDHQSQPSREKGVKLMAEKLDELNVAGDAVIWMGDFNATEDNPAVKFVKSSGTTGITVDRFPGLKESFDELHAGEKKRGTLHFWMSDPNRQWKVDHIFVSKEAKVLESRVVKSGEPYLSDHFPVSAKLRF